MSTGGPYGSVLTAVGGTIADTHIGTDNPCRITRAEDRKNPSNGMGEQRDAFLGRPQEQNCEPAGGSQEGSKRRSFKASEFRRGSPANASNAPPSAPEARRRTSSRDDRRNSQNSTGRLPESPRLKTLGEAAEDPARALGESLRGTQVGRETETLPMSPGAERLISWKIPGGPLQV